MMILIAFLVPVLSDGFQVHLENNSISPLSDAGTESTLPIFKCDQDGLSPNPRSCESFIKCSHHRRYVVPCPRGLHFKNETGHCEIPCEAQCDQKLACECGWSTCITECEESYGIYAHPVECEKFIKCDARKPTVLECSRGKAFDVNRKKCIPKNEVNCKIDSENELPAISLS